MKRIKDTRKAGLYFGSFIGLLFFALNGLIPSVYGGGMFGLTLAASLFGNPPGSELLPRLIVALFMIFGTMVAGTVYTLGTGAIGWLIGNMIHIITSDRTRYVRITPQRKSRIFALQGRGEEAVVYIYTE